MGAATAVLERTITQPMINTTPPQQTKILDFPFPRTSTERYFDDSEFYQIKGGYTAELIGNTRAKIAERGLTNQITKELGSVLLEAFERGMEDADIFLSGEKFTRVAINVDWLVVVRKDKVPIAFGSGTFITPFLFYLNGAMVVPKYQSAGVGYIANALLWHRVTDIAAENGYNDPDIICRTHNSNVVSAFLHTFRNGTVSTECNIDAYTHMLFKKTAEYLGCSIDPLTGVSYGVYPEGLPSGKKGVNAQINDAFKLLGRRDALYVTGRLDKKHIENILKKTVNVKKVQVSNHDYSFRQPIPAFI